MAEQRVPQRGEPLTARELEVVRLVGEGLLNPAIGKALFLSPLTVKAHMARIGMKLGTGDRAGIVGAAFRTGQLRVVRSDRDVELDPRETQVLIGIARGRSNGEIATEMFLSHGAVQHSVRSILRVLGVSGRAAAVRAGFECGALTLVPRQRSGADVNRAAVAGAPEALAACQTRNAPTSASPVVSVALRPSPRASAPEAKGAR